MRLIVIIGVATGFAAGCKTSCDRVYESKTGAIYINELLILDDEGAPVVDLHDVEPLAQRGLCVLIWNRATVDDVLVGWDVRFDWECRDRPLVQLAFWRDDFELQLNSELWDYDVEGCSTSIKDCPHCPPSADWSLRYTFDNRPETHPDGWCDETQAVCQVTPTMYIDMEFWDGDWVEVEE